MKQEKYTIKNFQRDFPDDDACLEYIFRQKYGNDPACPKCSKKGFHRVKERKCYACAWCAYQLHPTAGTIFHKSSTKLTLWFFAIFLASQSKNGVSAKELERHLGVTYKCAWRIAKKIRDLMKQGDGKLSGTIEADETYMGGKGKKVRGRGSVKKTPVIGVVQRKGDAKVKAVKDVSRYTVMNYIGQNVAIGSELMTDEYPVYSYANKLYKHNTIKHLKNNYVQGDIHTNTVEGLWSQIKRSIDGTYHAVSKKYLQNYLDEFAYRYNHRQSETPIFHLLLARLVK